MKSLSPSPHLQDCKPRGATELSHHAALEQGRADLALDDGNTCLRADVATHMSTITQKERVVGPSMGAGVGSDVGFSVGVGVRSCAGAAVGVFVWQPWEWDPPWASAWVQVSNLAWE